LKCRTGTNVVSEGSGYSQTEAIWMNTGLLCSAAVVVILSAPYQASAQQGDGTEVQITTNVFKPNKLPPTSDRIGQLKVPDGFKVAVRAGAWQ
jgi:hypothetical protein